MTETVDYVQFLGHELRSPLSAVKTALEVLQDELAELTEAPVSSVTEVAAPSTIDPRLQMVELALRNVQRLRRTVDWSQDLLSLAQQSPGANRRPVFLAALFDEYLTDLGPLVPSVAAGERVVTDPELLGLLLGQIRRVLEYDEHYRLCGLQVERIGQRLHISFEGERVTRTFERRSRPVTKTLLVSPDQNPSDHNPADLERLAAFMISTHLLQELAADLQILLPNPDRATVCLRLPLDD